MNSLRKEGIVGMAPPIGGYWVRCKLRLGHLCMALQTSTRPSLTVDLQAPMVGVSLLSFLSKVRHPSWPGVLPLGHRSPEAYGLPNINSTS